MRWKKKPLVGCLHIEAVKVAISISSRWRQKQQLRVLTRIRRFTIVSLAQTHRSLHFSSSIDGKQAPAEDFYCSRMILGGSLSI
jgi:hypothetical protein